MTIRGNFAPNSAPLSPKKVVNTSPERLKRLPSKQPVVGSNPTGGVSNQLRGRSTSHTTSSKLVVLTAVKIQSA